MCNESTQFVRFRRIVPPLDQSQSNRLRPACVRSFVPSFCKIVCAYPFTMPGLSTSTTAFAWFLKRRISFSRAVSDLGIRQDKVL